MWVQIMSVWVIASMQVICFKFAYKKCHILHYKGQLILKRLVGVFKFSQITNLKTQIFVYGRIEKNKMSFRNELTLEKSKFNTNRFRMFSKRKKLNLCRLFEYWAEKFTSAFTLEVLKAQKLFFSHAKAKNFFFIGTTVLQSLFSMNQKFVLHCKIKFWAGHYYLNSISEY